MICARCGHTEADGAEYCGRCGARFATGTTPDTRPEDAEAEDEGLLSLLLSRPLLGALGLGAAAGVMLIVALILTGGGSAKHQGSSLPGDPNAGVLLTPQLDVPSTPPVLVPSGTSTPAASQTPQPSPTPSGTPTPIAVGVTPLPLPTAVSTPVTLPPQKTSSRVAIVVTGGQGSVHHVGEAVQVCFIAIQGQRYRVFDPDTPTLLLAQGTGDGKQKCVPAKVSPPVGIDTVRIEALTNKGAAEDFAAISIIVQP